MSRKSFPNSPDRSLFLLPPSATRPTREDRTFELGLALLLFLLCVVTTGVLRG
jgi:hypothetical protein